jgi:hypothetical protein
VTLTPSITRSDAAILNFLLSLEFLERDLYATALETGAAGTGDQLEFVTAAHNHETAHVARLQELLGGLAIPEPTFDFAAAMTSPAAFLAAASRVEDLGVRAYHGQLPLITGVAAGRAAVAIHTVEANHAAWALFLAGEIPTPTGAFEYGLPMSKVQAQVAATGYVVSTNQPPAST